MSKADLINKLGVVAKSGTTNLSEGAENYELQAKVVRPKRRSDVGVPGKRRRRCLPTLGRRRAEAKSDQPEGQAAAPVVLQSPSSSHCVRSGCESDLRKRRYSTHL